MVQRATDMTRHIGRNGKDDDNSELGQSFYSWFELQILTVTLSSIEFWGIGFKVYGKWQMRLVSEEVTRDA